MCLMRAIFKERTNSFCEICSTKLTTHVYNIVFISNHRDKHVSEGRTWFLVNDKKSVPNIFE